jgi:hypothetical protein
MPKFSFAPLGDWQIDQSVPRARRARLLGAILFKDIVARLRSEAHIFRIKREAGDEGQARGLHRYVVTLTANPRTVDLWHNSRGGYRAQYYINPTLGNVANAYALDVIGAATARLIQQDSHRKRFWPLASKSIRHPETRLWIYQGHWFRHAKTTDRLLHVSGWQHHGQTDCKKATKLLNWGALLPGSEHRLVLKGQWLNKNGTPTRGPLKADRAQQISRYGFT